jgi:hypothetical protein
MKSMWKRRSRRQCSGAPTAAMRLSDGHRNASVWPEQKQLSSTGSPP